MSEEYMKRLLASDPRIRMVTYIKDPFTPPTRVARPNLDSIVSRRTETFTSVSVPAVMGTLKQYEADFGKLRFVGGVYEKLNFLFFSNEAGIFVISYDKVPMEEILVNLKRAINEAGSLLD